MPMATDETQARLLEAAGKVFAEKGFQQATVREILACAGIKNIAAINYYFGDKEKLYDATIRHAFQCRIEEMPLPQWEPGTLAVVKLHDFINVLVSRMLSKQMSWHLQLLMRELAQPTAIGEGLVRDFIRPIYQALWGLLREALGPDVAEERIHLIGFSIIGQCFYQRVAAPVLALVVGEEEYRSYDPARVANHIADFSLRALGLSLSDPKEVHS
jgi:TetR/AcrR family transcriptional regulator, regulator of cefoperazone and chloramphenicol sensitivity